MKDALLILQDEKLIIVLINIINYDFPICKLSYSKNLTIPIKTKETKIIWIFGKIFKIVSLITLFFFQICISKRTHFDF